MVDLSNGLQPSDFATVDAYVAAVKAEGDPPAPSGLDASLAAQRTALYDLVPHSEATSVAVKNGSWFDPTTWADGKVPGAGAKVLIPEAITVNYDGVSDASLFTVRVDGQLLFATDHDTRMVVDTLVVGQPGLLQVGTSDNPVQNGVNADIVIANNGPINTSWDPTLLSRGLISDGTVNIHGQDKTNMLKLAVDPMAGDTTLSLQADAAASGWHVGDKIVLTGTHVTPTAVPDGWVDQGSQDEVLTIKAISGSTITLDRALTYNHDSPRADLKAYVADYTRNVTIESQNADSLPVSQRGHVLFMESPAVDVEYAAFSGLGRTDKSVRAVDVASVTNITSDTNIKGRYALQVQGTGVEPGAQQAIINGNAVWGSPGWGIVQDASSAEITDNATYNTFGAGYVAASGNETGMWCDNIAIGAQGIGLAGSFMDKNAASVAANDLARTGDGFFFHGRMLKVDDNVAADVTEGFVYMMRGTGAPFDAQVLPQPEILHGLTSTTDLDLPPIQDFTDNEVLAANTGLIVVKAVPADGHDVRSVIDGFKAWEVAQRHRFKLHRSLYHSNADLTGAIVPTA